MNRARYSIFIGTLTVLIVVGLVVFNKKTNHSDLNLNEISLSSVTKKKTTIAKKFLGRKTLYKNFNDADSVTTNANSELNACAVELCGSPKNLFSIEELDEIKRNRDPSVMTKFENLIDLNFNQSLSALKAKINLKSKIKSRFNSQDTKNLIKDELKKIVLGFDYLSKIYDFFILYSEEESETSNLIYQNTIRFWKNLKPEKVDLVLKKMSLNAKEKPWMKEMINSGLLLDLKIPIPILLELELETIFKILYPNDNYNSALKKQIQKMNEFSNMFAKSIEFKGSAFNLLFPSAYSYSLDKDAVIDETDLNSEIQLHYIFTQFFDKKYENILNLDYDWKSYVGKTLTPNPKLAMLANNNRFLYQAKIKLKKDCTKSISIALDQSNSALKNRKFKGYLSELIDITKSKFQFTNNENKKIFNEKMNKLNLSISKDLSYLEKTIANTIKLYTENAMLTTESFSYDTESALQLILIGGEGDENPDLDAQIDWFISQLPSTISGLCETYMEPTLSDRMLGGHGQGKLSWSTVRFPKFGIGIAAHEIGHYVSNVLQDLGQEQNGDYYLGLNENLPLWESRSCINTWSNPDSSQLTESNLTEEDWADYFSAHITKSMNERHPWIHNFACQLFYEDYSGQYLTSLKANEGAMHSADLFRALNIQKTSGLKMPASCQKIIKDNKLFECSN